MPPFHGFAQILLIKTCSLFSAKLLIDHSEYYVINVSALTDGATETQAKVNSRDILSIWTEKKAKLVKIKVRREIKSYKHKERDK